MFQSPRDEYLAIFVRCRENILDALRHYGGYYRCPRDVEGRRIGPMVAYAATYNLGNQDFHFVGDVYANFAILERHDTLLNYFAADLAHLINSQLSLSGVHVTAFCGAPMGGIKLSSHLAYHTAVRGIFAEKEVLKAKSSGTKETSRLIWNRHEPETGDDVVIVEDVCNNFATTDKLCALIQERGAKTVAIACLFNRSPKGRVSYTTPSGNVIPVFSLLTQPTPEYQQDEEGVWDEIRDGNVVWNPKNKDEWARLMAAMEAAEK